jgi:hypothetical protein
VAGCSLINEIADERLERLPRFFGHGETAAGADKRARSRLPRDEKPRDEKEGPPARGPAL